MKGTVVCMQAIKERRVEKATIKWRAALGWEVGLGWGVSSPDASTLNSERDMHREVALKHRLCDSLHSCPISGGPRLPEAQNDIEDTLT